MRDANLGDGQPYWAAGADPARVTRHGAARLWAMVPLPVQLGLEGLAFISGGVFFIWLFFAGPE